MGCRWQHRRLFDPCRALGRLVALLWRKGFLYAAHCKLATRNLMAHIDGEAGRFVSVPPCISSTRRAENESALEAS